MRSTDSDEFMDRPATRLRIVLPQTEPAAASMAGSIFRWTLKIIFALSAGACCVALSSYVPTGGPAIAPFVPANSAAFLQISDGAELHRRLMASPAFNELLDDPDSAAFILALLHPEKSASTDSADDSNTETAAKTVRSELQNTLAKWHLSEERGADFYPLLGNELAVAWSPGEPAKKEQPQFIFFARVTGARGTLLRILAPFFKLKNMEFFDLGGGLMAGGLNGARPAFGAHPLAAVTRHNSADAATPLAWINFAGAGLSPPDKSAALAERLNAELQNEDSALAHMAEAGVPEYMLRALLDPPDVSAMLHVGAPLTAVQLKLFGGDELPGGGLALRGRMQGEIPPLQISSVNIQPEPPAAHPAKSAAAIAECVLPVDLRALFIRHVAGSMKLVNLPGLTRPQRRWIARFRALEADGADPEKDLWPALGHVMKLSIFEPKSDAAGTALGTARAWLSFAPQEQDAAFFSAGDLARVRWDYLFEENEKATAKPPYIRRFHRDAGTLQAQELFVLATGQINAPAWSLGPKGLRLTSEAGVFALRDGPLDSDFPEPPEHLDKYLIRLDGARLAPTAEALATVLYDDLEEELGNAQKFNAQYPHRELHIRLARKWTRLLGNLEFSLTPSAQGQGGEVALDWHPGTLAGSTPEPERKSSPRGKKAGTVQEPESNEDDSPPPPPPPAN